MPLCADEAVDDDKERDERLAEDDGAHGLADREAEREEGRAAGVARDVDLGRQDQDERPGSAAARSRRESHLHSHQSRARRSRRTRLPKCGVREGGARCLG